MSAAHEAAPRRPEARWVIDAIAVTLLTATIGGGFQPVFESWGFLLPVLAGAIPGVGIGILAGRRRWSVATTAIATVLTALLVGPAAALPVSTFFGIPTLESLRLLATGLVTSWKSFLTAGLPLSAADHGVVPFVVMLLCGVVSASLAVRLRSAAWTMVPLGLTAVAVALLGARTATMPVALGAVFATIAITWLGIRQAGDPSRQLLHVHAETTLAHARSLRRRRLVAGAAVVALAMAGGSVAGVAIFPDGITDRVVARDHVTAPLDVRAYTSPLQSFRAFVRDRADTPQFTITGLPSGARVRLAALDAYDGLVLHAAGDGSSGSGRFDPLSTGGAAAGVSLTRVSVTVDDYDDVWVPTVGAVRQLTYDAPRGTATEADERRSTFVNATSDTVVNTRRLTAGMSYSMQTDIRRPPSAASLANAEFAVLRTPPATNVPEDIAALAAAATADAKTPLEKVESLAGWLTSTGYFSHGLEGDAPSLSGHGALRLHDFLTTDPMVGDDEQYAVTMMLMAAQLGIPARVVMGWYPGDDAGESSTFVANGDDLHAWVEVAFAGHGWVAFDAAPPPDKVPRESAPRPRSDPKPQVLQPPIPPQEPADDLPLAPHDRDGARDDEQPKDQATDWTTVLVIAAAGTGGILIVAPLVIVLLLKAVRRRRRRRSPRPSARIAGGWDEIVDRAVDLRVPITAGATRAETARTLQRAFPGVGVIALASRVDVGVYGPAEVDTVVADGFWAELGTVVHGMRRSVSRVRRMRARISLRSVIGARGRVRDEEPMIGEPSGTSASAGRERA